jgi:hypothetical protein
MIRFNMKITIHFSSSMLVAIRHHVRFHGKSFLKILPLLGASPPLRHHHNEDDVLPTTKPGLSHCAPSPNGGLVVQEGGNILPEKRNITEPFFRKGPLAVARRSPEAGKTQ